MEIHKEEYRETRYPFQEQRVRLHCVAACISAKENHETLNGYLTKQMWVYTYYNDFITEKSIPFSLSISWKMGVQTCTDKDPKTTKTLIEPWNKKLLLTKYFS